MKYLLTVILISIQVLVMAQITNRKTTVNGQQVRVHLIQKGETVYALARMYDVSASDLLKLNPKASEGLSIGQEFFVPDSNKKDVSTSGKSHEVKAGETLFSISRQYNVDVEQIKKVNNMQGNDLALGQVLVIPGSVSEVVVESVPAQSKGGYTVGKGETLFAISRKTGVSVDNLMKWNGLKNGDISEGQQLLIKSPVQSVSNESNESNETTNKINTVVEPEIKEVIAIETKETVVKKEDPVAVVKPAENTYKDEPIDEYVEVLEKGVAELIPDTDGTRKYLALHRTVKPGTIVRVRNDMNGREVWARVVGPLPDTGDNKDILIKISKAAYDRLGALDKKFRVTITYIP